jgi:hypothetical protein
MQNVQRALRKLITPTKKETVYVKKTVVVICGIIILLASLGSVEAAEKGPVHKAPHGGVIEEADEVHGEFLIDKGGQQTLYLYDKSMKPLERSGVEPRVTIKGKGKSATEETRVLNVSKDSKEGAVFKGEPLKGTKDWETAVVSLKLKDSPTEIRFARHSDGHGH